MSRTEPEEDGDVELVYTLDEALTAVGFGKFQALAMAYAGLGTMAEAMEVMILSFIGPSVKAEWGLSPAQESLITTVVFAGMLIGAYFWGIISDNHGRRWGLLSIAVVSSIFAILSTFSLNYGSLVLLRMVVGVGIGGSPVYSSWFLEFVPVHNRGIWMVLFATFWTFGTILESLLAWVVMPRLGWRWLLALSSVPCITALILYSLTVESPRYLYQKGRITDAHNVLKKMAAINKTQLPSGMLVSDQIDDRVEESAPLEHTRLLSPSTNKYTVVSKPGFSLLFTQLLSPSLLKTTLLLWAVFFANSFSYYGVVLMTTELTSGQSKCWETPADTNLLTGSSLYKTTFITSIGEVPGLIFSAVLVDKIGRRFSLVVMYAFAFAVLLPLMFHQNEVLTIVLIFGARMCIIGAFTVSGIYCPELYPTSMRTTGLGLANVVGRIGGMISPLVAIGLVSGCHQMAAVSLFELVIFLSGLSVMLYKVETKERELDRIA